MWYDWWYDPEDIEKLVAGLKRDEKWAELRLLKIARKNKVLCLYCFDKGYGEMLQKTLETWADLQEIKTGTKPSDSALEDLYVRIRDSFSKEVEKLESQWVLCDGQSPHFLKRLISLIVQCICIRFSHSENICHREWKRVLRKKSVDGKHRSLRRIVEEYAYFYLVHMQICNNRA